jgi:Fe-S cluster biogenesis protein NfuA
MSDTLSQEIRVRGEFTPDPDSCRFIVSREVFEDDWTFQFRSPEDAPGSQLIKELFAIEGVDDVKIHRDTFTIHKNIPDPWPKIAQKVIPVLKETLQQEAGILDESKREELKNAPLDGEMRERIEQALSEQINPALASHGGWVKLVKIEGQDVYVEMGGGCQGCASSRATMKFGVERAVKEAAPAVRNVIDATDHEAGSNPYYS